MVLRLGLLFYVICFCTVSYGQGFVCSGEAIVSAYDGTNTTLYRPVYIPFSSPFLSPVANYSNQHFDALGFNSADNNIYAVDQNSNEIVRLNKNGQFELVGSDVFMVNANIKSADCTPEGQYIVYDPNVGGLLEFDVLNDFSILRSIDLYWSDTAPVTGSVLAPFFDIVVDPNDPGRILAFQPKTDSPDNVPVETRGYLHEIIIDPNSGAAGSVTPLVALGIDHLGGLSFDSRGSLYGFGGWSSGTTHIEDTYVAIDIGSGAVTPVVEFTEVNSSDGSSCPYSLTFSNSVPTEGMYCSGDTKVFQLEIANNSYFNLEGITVKDSFPEGMVVESVSKGTGLEEWGREGIGTNVIVVNDISIPQRSKVVIEVKVHTVDTPVQEVFNQAELTNLPPRFPSVIRSDNLGTTTVLSDPSNFLVIPRDLLEVSWSIQSPTDCINANDGYVRLSSSTFVSGQTYEVKFRDVKAWEEHIRTVMADSENRLLLDSLYPAEYQIYGVRTLTDNCALSIRDTTVMLLPPNDLLQLNIEGDSMLCAGSNLTLVAKADPEGVVIWDTPNLVGIQSDSVYIMDPVEDDSGDYKAVVTAGYCEVESKMTVSIHPQLELKIEGDTVYCERDSLILAATGQGTEVSYNWNIPSSTLQSDSTLIISPVEQSDEGIYTVTASNGACNDTVQQEVVILNSPSVSLPAIFSIDFCDETTLIPIITNDEFAEYRWSPSEGLSCDDCQSPELRPLIQENYTVTVSNGNGCKDSTSVKVLLDKSKLVFSPSVFSPNSNSVNGRFSLSPNCVTERILELEIYDRWGGTVYRSNDFSSDKIFWDGTFSGYSVSAGVYVWKAKVQLVDGTQEVILGDVTLLK